MSYYQTIFQNRTEAGSYLAEYLFSYKDKKPLILGIAPEGVPVASKAAEILESPLDVIVARTLFAPGNKHIVLGAIAAGDVVVVDRSIQISLGLSDNDMNKLIESERKEMAADMIHYGSGSHVARVSSPHTLVVVDDGLASSVTIRATIEAARILYNPQQLVFASPICAYDTLESIKSIVDDIVAVNTPKHVYSIGNWYYEYDRVSEKDVKEYLKSKASKFVFS
ncbi:hypothetical protein KW782_00165 [Candidatus Parcubacteria bacterium]|nr:hypothetical protein [Candidatus Parcubacteria bacterium]